MDPIELLNAFFEMLIGLGVDVGTEDEPEEERIARLSAELASGDRTFVDIFDSLLAGNVFPQLGIADEFTGADATRIAGEVEEGRTLDDLINSLDMVVERVTGEDLTGGGVDQTIPADGQLIRITDPSGTDAATRYVVVYEVLGVSFSYDIGDAVDFLELFPSGESAFASVQTLTQGQFDDLGVLEVGAVDEILGQTESLTSQFERELTALGVEGLPTWLADDAQALVLLATAADEDWSSTRLWSELSSTDGFQGRFGAFDSFAIAGETVETTINRLMAAEEQLVGAILQYRPAGFTITTSYLQDVLDAGWDASEVGAVLEAEQMILNNPESLTIYNTILTLSGLDTVDEAGLVEAIAGVGEPEIIEALNETAVALALTEAGLGDDVDLATIVEIIDDASQIRTADDFTQLAQNLALEFARNEFELDTEKFGITSDDLVATFFGEESPTGRSAGEILNTLAKFERERRAAATGFGGTQAFVNAQGNLVAPGFSGL